MYVIGRVIHIAGKGFGRAGKRPAQHRFVDEVDSELERMGTHNVAQVVAELVFLLIAQVGEKSNRRSELVVAIGFETGDGQRCGTEGEGQRVAQIGVPGLRKMQQAEIEDQGANRAGIESIGIADRRVPVVVVRKQTG